MTTIDGIPDVIIKSSVDGTRFFPNEPAYQWSTIVPCCSGLYSPQGFTTLAWIICLVTLSIDCFAKKTGNRTSMVDLPNVS